MWWHKEPTEAGLWFKNKFPERWEYLEELKKNIKIYKMSDLEELYENLR